MAAAGDDGSAVIWVRDTGIGIPDYDQKELFTGSTEPRTRSPAGSPAPASA